MSLRLRAWFLVAGFGLVIAAFVVACGGDDDDPDGGASAGGDTPVVEASATAATGGGPAGVPTSGGGGGSSSGPAPPGFPASDEPPSTTATANGQTVETGLGTYCWTLMCVDKIGVPTKGTLTVSSGDTVSFAVPAGAPPLRDAAANTFEARDAQQLDDGSEIWPYPGNPGESQEYAVAGDEVEVMVDLAPGTYVLVVSMYFEAGDAVYGVLLEVQ